MDDLEVFAAVVDAGGFSAAAVALGTTATATSRRVKALEERLGVRLLNRTTRRISLTEAGQIYYAQVRRLLADLRETEEQLSQIANELRGALRITAPMSFGVRRLAPLVARFVKQHPQVEIELQLDDRMVDIVDEGLDLALRIGYPRDSSLIMRRIATIPRYVCASPAYLAARGLPEQPLDLLQHNCLHYNNLRTREEWTLTGPEGADPVAVHGNFCSNNGSVLCAAAVQGLGIALLPEFIVAADLAAGRLQRVLQGHEPPPFGLYGLYPSRQFVPAKIKLFLDFLGETLVHGSGDKW